MIHRNRKVNKTEREREKVSKVKRRTTNGWGLCDRASPNYFGINDCCLAKRSLLCRATLPASAELCARGAAACRHTTHRPDRSNGPPTPSAFPFEIETAHTNAVSARDSPSSKTNFFFNRVDRLRSSKETEKKKKLNLY